MAISGEDSELRLEFDLEDNGGLLRFDTLEDVKAWCDKEAALWNWLGNTEPSRITNLSHRFFDAGFNHIGSQINSAKNARDTGVQYYPDCVRGMKAAFVERYVSLRYLLASNSPKGRYVLELAKRDPDIAAYAVAHYTRLDIQQNTWKCRQGIALATIIEAKLLDTGDSQESAFDDLRELWTNELKGFKKEYESLQSQYAELNKSAATSLALFQTNEKSERASAQSMAAEQFAKHEKRMSEIQQLFETRLKLEAPVEYWRQKKHHHEKVRNYLTGVCALVGGAGFSFLAWLVSSEFATKPAQPEANIKQLQESAVWGAGIPWHPIILFVIVSSAVFWAVRICVRLLLSNIHLVTDAHEREVMAMTYLALSRANEQGGSYVSNEHIGIVLAALFRPTASGIVSDDGAPATAYEMLQSMAQKSK